MNIIQKTFAYIASIALIVIAGVFVQTKALPVEASISVGSSYQSVVTAPGLQTSGVIKSLPGTLGSVVITGAAAGTFTLYDASTTDKNLRTPVGGSTATSSLRQLASFPTNAAVGTYTFDSNFFNGLVVEFLSTQGTTTITSR